MKKIKILYASRPSEQINPSGIPYFVLRLKEELIQNKLIDLHLYNLNFNYCQRLQTCSFFGKNSPILCKPCKLLYHFNKIFILPFILYFGKYDFYIETEQLFLPIFVPSHTKVINMIYDIGLILYDDIQTQKLTKIWRFLLPISIKNSDYIITISQSSMDDLETYFQSINLQKEVSYIYCDSSFHNISSNRKPFQIINKLDHNSEYILFLGTLEPRKNPLNTVKAFHKFKINNPNNPIKLVFAGRKGWLYDNVIDYIKFNSLASEIIFTGYISDEEKYVLLKHAKAFLFLSIYEGFGIPPLEALKLGTPCLLSDIPVFHELFEENALYVPHDNIEIISKGMNEILIHPPQIDPAWFEKFGWDKSAEKLIQFMKDKMDS